MTLEEQLRHAFDSLASRLREEVTRHAGMAIDELASTAETERAEAVAEAARDAWEAARREGETKLASGVADAEARVREVAQAMATASRLRLLDTIRAIDGAGSLTDILGILVSAAANEMGRAALLLTDSGELRSWRTVGFASQSTDGDGSPALVSSLADGGIVTDAAETGEAVHVPGASSPPPAFAELPGGRAAAAVPLRMGGRVFAVLYADAGAQDSPGDSPWSGDGGGHVVEVVARHAARCLESVTTSRLAQVGGAA